MKKGSEKEDIISWFLSFSEPTKLSVHSIFSHLYCLHTSGFTSFIVHNLLSSFLKGHWRILASPLFSMAISMPHRPRILFKSEIEKYLLRYLSICWYSTEYRSIETLRQQSPQLLQSVEGIFSYTFPSLAPAEALFCSNRIASSWFSFSSSTSLPNAGLFFSEYALQTDLQELHRSSNTSLYLLCQQMECPLSNTSRQSVVRFSTVTLTGMISPDSITKPRSIHLSGLLIIKLLMIIVPYMANGIKEFLKLYNTTGRFAICNVFESGR